MRPHNAVELLQVSVKHLGVGAMVIVVCFAGRSELRRLQARKDVDAALGEDYIAVAIRSKYPPAEPEALRLLAPQRGLIATGQKSNPIPRQAQRDQLVTGGPGEADCRKCQTSTATPAEPGDLLTDEETLTALGGIPLVAQAFRSLGLPQSVKDHVRVKERERGYDEATFVGSFVILNAAGGESVDDFGHLREDPELAEMIGHALPSSSAALQFLYAFHEDEKIEEAKQQRFRAGRLHPGKITPPLVGLGQFNRDLVQRFGPPSPPQRIAAANQEATIIESHRRPGVWALSVKYLQVADAPDLRIRTVGLFRRASGFHTESLS